MTTYYVIDEGTQVNSTPSGMTLLTLDRGLGNLLLPTVDVQEGDIYYFDPGVGGLTGTLETHNVVFTSDTSSDVAATFHFSADNSNTFTVSFTDNLLSAGVTPTLIVDDNISLTNLTFDASNAAGALTATIGNSAFIAEIDGGSSADSITTGTYASMVTLNAGDGENVINLGDGTQISNLTTGDDNDTLTFGTGVQINTLLTLGDGADTVNLADNDYIAEINAGADGLTIAGGNAEDVTIGDINIAATALDVSSTSITLGDRANVGDITAEGNEEEAITLGNDATIGDVQLHMGNDTLILGDNANAGYLTVGDDSLTGDDNDTVEIGANSTVTKIVAGTGDDSISIGANSEITHTSNSFELGDGDDTLTLGDGVTVVGATDLGDGDDTINVGNDVILGDIYAGDGALNIYGAGSDNVTIGDITIDSDTDVEETHIVLGDNASIGSVTAGSGSNELEMIELGAGSTIGDVDLQEGNDSIILDEGSTAGVLTLGDSLELLETDDDTVEIGANSTVTEIITGDGDDSVTIDSGVQITGSGGVAIDLGYGADTLTIRDDAVISGTIDFGEDLAGSNDRLNLLIKGLNTNDTLNSDFRAALASEGYEDLDNDGVYTLSASATDDTFTWNGVTYDNVEEIQGIPCFSGETLIRTEKGERPIRDLVAGDRVWAEDRGLQPIRWIGSRHLSQEDLQSSPHLRPVRICAGSLGEGTPQADLLVSPQHRILVRSRIAQRMFGAEEVLIAAKHLCGIEGIDIATDVEEVTYFHMLFDRHEIVLANGAEAEALLTGPEALRSVEPAALREILELFPELADPDFQPVAARIVAQGRLGRRLVARHRQNAKALVDRRPVIAA